MTAKYLAFATTRLALIATGIAVLASYVPQLRAILRSGDGKGVSLVTCSLWCGASAVSVLYAATAVRDVGMLLMALGNLAGSAAVMIATLWRRRRAPVNPSTPRPA